LPDFSDYIPADAPEIENIFGAELGKSIVKENAEDACAGISADLLKKNWSAVCNAVDSIPAESELIKVYKKLGMLSSLSDIGVPEEKLGMLLQYSPLVRNRLTLMRLRRAIKI
jgi:glycerol-1-phosphate dehydrogenase [NAD(P)+]